MKQRLLNNKKLIFLALLIIVVGVAAAVLIFKKDSPKPLGPGEINYGPPTKQEAAAGDEQKAKIAEREARVGANNNSSSGSATSSKKSTSVVITDANQYDNTVEVRAFMPDYYEDGTCTSTFTRGSLSVTKSMPAYRDATTTICTNPLISRSEFSQAGDWQVVVTYSSATATGTSAAQKVTIK